MLRRILILGVLVTTVSLSGQPVIYHHPVYDLSITASSGWGREIPDNPEGTVLFTHPNRNMQVRLGFVEDCSDPVTYLKGRTGQEGVVCNSRFFDTTLTGGQALVARGFVLEQRRSYSCLVVGLPYRNGLYLVEIRCPEDCYAAHLDDVRNILASVRIGAPSLR